MPAKFLAGSCLLMALLAFSGCNPPEPVSTNHDNHDHTTEVTDQSRPQPVSETDRLIRKIVDSEELNQSLSPLLGHLANILAEQKSEKLDFLSPNFLYEGLTEFDLNSAIANGTDIFAKTAWPLGASQNMANATDIWQPLLNDYKLEGAKFGITGGEFGDDENQYTMQTVAEGHFSAKSDPDGSGRKYGFSSHQVIEWANLNDQWTITAWTQNDFHVISSKDTMFANVTETAIPDESTRKRVTQSIHEEMIIERLKANSLDPPRPNLTHFADWESSNQYPAVSVVDIDSDGWDDLFLVDRWAPATLLHNKGDGTFEDITESSGLEIQDFGNCALFFDFDNDGDSDCFVGRTREPSRFFLNEGGKFKPFDEMNELMADTLCVVSGSVVDINRDGLLDLYLCTYGYGAGPIEKWIDETVREEDKIGMKIRFDQQSAYLDRVGSPNVVLMNVGGKFERPVIDNNLKQWRNSYQSVWADFDNDGDLDMYISNDFSPDAFLRNDTPRGEMKPKFTDITEEIVTDGSIGFGMGASFGDYNNDGNLDLYVSNMYSKAGMRIVSQLDQVDPRIAVSARGNFLYHNDGKSFKQIAGFGPNDIHVSKVGWSYGGQWADFDNDGFLDLYVPSGYFTAPKVVATTTDL